MGSVIVWMDMKGHFVNTVWMSARPAPVKMEGHVWMDIKTTVVSAPRDLQVYIACVENFLLLSFFSLSFHLKLKMRVTFALLSSQF